jgi:hypothetical protein
MTQKMTRGCSKSGNNVLNSRQFIQQNGTIGLSLSVRFGHIGSRYPRGIPLSLREPPFPDRFMIKPILFYVAHPQENSNRLITSSDIADYSLSKL